jgi:hypothetical protein
VDSATSEAQTIKRHTIPGLLILTLTLTAASCPNRSPNPGSTPEIDSCSVFPANNIWNVRIDALPVHPNSEAYLGSIGLDEHLKADFGSGTWEGGPIGIPYTTVTNDQPAVEVEYYYSKESDAGPYPIPFDAPIEGGPQSSGDRHVLVINTDTCMLYELFDAHAIDESTWTAGSGAIFDLGSNELRPAGYTSADAAGLPIFSGLVRYEEIENGSINHAIRFTVPSTQRAYLWPARHFASSDTNPDLPPMGLRLRLRADYDTSAFSSTNQIFLQALKEYGLILADNGSAIFLSGAPDERWDNDELRELMAVTAADLEAVDVSSLMIDPGSAMVQ